ncbi:hypothetical protein BU26DRAFT_294154 [Trematosphaeria pertusa]|uniref:Uncharacterized protein n=1 Tax=Trematosphaeria pertusa TaxID=390896 RepID=A0A6A6IIY2_9PLEO|nr:uncharacterized protein BU26DRAFT_294154 [Trematosphaeria pertusa]KAF2250008.1 hypothetical protein BU26DRAFT_294154 [Trematosphaeria pertusa]
MLSRPLRPATVTLLRMYVSAGGGTRRIFVQFLCVDHSESVSDEIRTTEATSRREAPAVGELLPRPDRPLEQQTSTPFPRAFRSSDLQHILQYLHPSPSASHHDQQVSSSVYPRLLASRHIPRLHLRSPQPNVGKTKVDEILNLGSLAHILLRISAEHILHHYTR